VLCTDKKKGMFRLVTQLNIWPRLFCSVEVSTATPYVVDDKNHGHVGSSYQTRAAMLTIISCGKCDGFA